MIFALFLMRDWHLLATALVDVPLAGMTYQSMHSDSFKGFVNFFDKVLMRMARVSMSLKTSKCSLLYPKLEVLGYYIITDGISHAR